MRRTGAEELHPANVAALGVGRSYGSKEDTPGTLRVSTADNIDSPFENMQYSPGMPIGNVQAKVWFFHDDDDLSANKWKVRKTPGSTGTTAAIINGRGGGVTFVNGDSDDDITMMETANEITSFDADAEMWFKWRVKVSKDSLQNSGDTFYMGIMDKAAGDNPPSNLGLRCENDNLSLAVSLDDPDYIAYEARVFHDGQSRGESSGTLLFDDQENPGTSTAIWLNDGNWHNIQLHIEEGNQPDVGFGAGLLPADLQRREVHIFVDGVHQRTFQIIVPAEDTDCVVYAGVHKNNVVSGVSTTVSVQGVVMVQEEVDDR